MIIPIARHIGQLKTLRLLLVGLVLSFVSPLFGQLQFLYVANLAANNVSGFVVNPATGALTNIAGSPFATGPNPRFVTIHPNNRFLYVVNDGSGTISAFSIDQAHGSLTPITGSPFPGLTGTMVIDPTGNFAYTGNNSGASMLISQIDPTSGALHTIQTVSPGGGAGLGYTGVSPNGQYVYAGNIRSGGVYVWSRNSTTGLLTAVAGSPFVVQGGSGADPSTMIVDPLGRFLYTPNGNVPSVSAFAISQTTGALSPVPGAPFPSGAYSTGGAADPSGRFVYAANCRSDTVSAYLINPVTGALADVPGSPISLPTNSCPTEIAVDSTGHYVAVASQISNNVTVFNINSSTGALTQVPGSPFAAGSEALGLAYAVGTAPVVLTPDHGGNAGSVTVQITGSGFQDGANVKLTGLGPDIPGENTTVPNSSFLTTTFDLTSAAVGSRSLFVTNPDSSAVSLANAFSVVQGGMPQVSVNIVGRNQIRIGTAQTYYLQVTNSGTVDSGPGLLALDIPQAISAQGTNGSGLYVAGTTSDPTFQIPTSDDTVNQSILFATQGVPAESSQYAPVQLTLSPNTLSSFAATAAWEQNINHLSFDAFLALKGLSPLTLNVQCMQCSSQYLAQYEAYAAASDAYSALQTAETNLQSAETDVYVAIGTSVVAALVVSPLCLDLGPLLAPACAVGVTTFVSKANACLQVDLSSPDGQSCIGGLQTAALTEFSLIRSYAGMLLPKIFTTALGTLSTNLGLLTQSLNAGAALVQDYGDEQLALANLNRLIGQGGPYQTARSTYQACANMAANRSMCTGPSTPPAPSVPGTTSTTVSGVTSVDPNDKTGGPGTGSAKYISGQGSLPYSIYFENQKTATASAQTISIVDVLDNNIDLSALELGPITFPNQVITPPTIPLLVAAFSTTVDLRPTVNLLVKIGSSLSLSSRTITWTFQSLDPVTGLPPTDPTAGFLPPGAEGSVFFTANPKSTLATGAVIPNTATIVFDSNAPIATPTWSNTIDNTAPTSHVLALTAIQSSLVFAVQWSGSDVGAGVQDYTIYVSDNGGSFTTWLSNTTAIQGTYVGVAGHTYRFYAIARDLVGNVETAKTLPEASTQIVLNPNPLIVVKSTLSRDSQSNVIVSLTLTNTGGATAQNALVTVAKIGSVAASSIPNTPLTIAAGASVTVQIVFPSSVGSANAATTLTTSGTYTGGSFSFTTRITLP